MLSRQDINKRIKLRHTEDKTFFPKKYAVPQEGYDIDQETSEKEKGIVFYVPKEEEYFDPADLRLLYDPLEVYKAGLILDRVHGVKRLKAPDRWCVLPKSETVTVEVPLTEYKDYGEYGEEVVQELGHVAWYKAYFHVDHRVYDETQVDVGIRQVLHKVEVKRLPRWKTNTVRNRPWNVESIGEIEIPGTVFCTEHKVIKKLKFVKGDKPEVVHQTDVSHTTRGTGCSVFRRSQPPTCVYPAEQPTDKIWNGLQNRNQWVFSSLFNIWTGEESVSDNYGNQWKERVYWTGPAQYYQRNEYLQCHYPPYCVNIVEEVAEEEEHIEVDEDSTVW